MKQEYDFSKGKRGAVAPVPPGKTRVTIRLDDAKLSDEGVQVEQPVTMTVENVSLKSGLNLLLPPLQLTWVIRDEVLQITTRADARRQLETRVLSIQSLLKGLKALRVRRRKMWRGRSFVFWKKMPAPARPGQRGGDDTV